MVFSSLIFICIFLPIMIIGYNLLPMKCRNIYLLLGSLFFYAWGEPKYIFLMLASIIGNYYFGVYISESAKLFYEKKEEKYSKRKKLILILTIVFNIGLLIYFKYFGLILESVKAVLGLNFNVPQIALPIGISFFTFQGMSYVIDVYRNDYVVFENDKPVLLVQKNFINLALYISMFPQLIAGPIVRFTDIKDYLNERVVNSEKFSRGVERFIMGLAKKVILANSLGEISDKIFNYDVNYIGPALAWLGAIFYTLQIYFDFSGYSDMAIGLGKMFGFEFNENFNYPYISTSITEFWRRWHISLSSWFRDYLYIPLGGNRKGNVYFNLFMVFLATGIWHGAAWGYLVWGLFHGVFMLIERFFRKKTLPFKIPKIAGWIYTMLVVVLGWVLFKLEDLGKAISYIGSMLNIGYKGYVMFDPGFFLDNKTIFILIIALIVCLPVKEIIEKNFKFDFKGEIFVTVKRILLIILFVICIMFIVNSTYNPFIYFRF